MPRDSGTLVHGSNITWWPGVTMIIINSWIYENIFAQRIFLLRFCHLCRCSSCIYKNIFAQRSSWAKGSRPRDHKVGASPLVVVDHDILIICCWSIQAIIIVNCPHYHFHCKYSLLLSPLVAVDHDFLITWCWSIQVKIIANYHPYHFHCKYSLLLSPNSQKRKSLSPRPWFN